MSTPCKLIALTPFPPGAFPYSQTVNGVTYKWPDVGLDLVSQAQKISSFRKANNLPRASLDDSIEDLNIYTCQRLGCDPRWCDDGVTKQVHIQTNTGGGCRTCGVRIN